MHVNGLPPNYIPKQSNQNVYNYSAQSYQTGMPHYRQTGVAIAYNPRNYQSNNNGYRYYQQQKQNEIMNYYRNVSNNNEHNEPITLSWQINAYVEEQKEGFLKRCFKRCKRDDKVDDYSINQYQNPYIQPIPTKNDEPKVKHILKNVTGIVKPGQLCAIMGASGAGKTTLLNVLNFRNRGKLIVDGKTQINGKEVGWKEITSCSGYVQQEDIFIGTLTVREHLTFLAIMKMGKNFTKQQKMQRVEEVLIEMNILHIQDTYIGQGDRLKGISGGEKRRLAFASEILTDPQLLFCDEPTSGLDSFMAQSVVDSMHILAKEGKTVISTIHQPSSQIFEKFDVLCLLGEGRVAYFGPTREALNYFQSIGRPCPPLYNPADHYIQVLAIVPNEREKCLRNVNAICDNFERSQYKQNILKSTQEQHLKQNNNFDEYRKNKKRYNTSYLTQTIWLLWRQHKNNIREPIATRALFAQTIIVGIFLGLIYLRLDENEIGVQNRSGLILILLMQTSFGYIFPVINSFPAELQVFYRESKNRVYSAVPYYFAKQLAELPKHILFPFILSTITYWMSNLRNDGKTYIIIVIIFIICAQVSLGLGTLLSILAPNTDAAVGLAAPMILPLLIFAGVFLNNNSTPDYLIWLKYISFFYYGYDAISIELWNNPDVIPCSKPNQIGCKNSQCFNNGFDVLNKFGISKSNFDRDIGILFLLLALPRILGLIVLKIKASRL